MEGLRRGAAAIVGVAESDLGAVAKEMSAIDLMAQGVQRALADCGLHLRDIDGLLCATAQSRTSGLSLVEYLGISPAFIDSTILGGSSFMFHVAHAGRPSARSVHNRSHRLRQHPTYDRPPAGRSQRVQSLRDSVSAVSAVDRLCIGSLSPYARIRHDSRAIGRGCSGGA